MHSLLKASLTWAMATAAVGALAGTELVIATVNNGHMIEMQKLTPGSRRPTPTSRSNG